MFKVIDIHVHMQPLDMMKPECRELIRRTQPNFDHIYELTQSPEKFIAQMDKEGIEKVGVINYVAPRIMGFTEEANDWAANYARHHRDRLLPFGSVDPTTAKDPAGEMDRIIHDLKLAALKLHPPHQLFYPNDYLDGLKALEVIYRKAEEARLPVMIHTGTSIFRGARSKFGNPFGIDDVALDFPNLPLLIAHGGRPLWMKESVFLTRRFPNVYLEISSIPPQYLLEYFPVLEKIADKVIWGSDWPGPMVPGMKENVDRFVKLPISDEVKQKILYDNAARLFGL